MAHRRTVRSVALSPEQRERLERLWFYYGNYGPQTTPGNHSFIQRLLENGIDERSLQTKRTPKSEMPTPECERAVEAILSMQSKHQSRAQRMEASGPSVVGSAEEQPPRERKPEMKDILDDMKRRYRVMPERLESESDMPDAA